MQDLLTKRNGRLGLRRVSRSLRASEYPLGPVERDLGLRALEVPHRRRARGLRQPGARREERCDVGRELVDAELFGPRAALEREARRPEGDVVARITAPSVVPVDE